MIIENSIMILSKINMMKYKKYLLLLMNKLNILIDTGVSI